MKITSDMKKRIGKILLASSGWIIALLLLLRPAEIKVVEKKTSEISASVDRGKAIFDKDGRLQSLEGDNLKLSQLLEEMKKSSRPANPYRIGVSVGLSVPRINPALGADVYLGSLGPLKFSAWTLVELNKTFSAPLAGFGGLSVKF